jgi:hypothetical protein
LKYKSGEKKSTPIRTKEEKLDENNNLDLLYSNITFEDINQNDDLIAVYLEHQNDEKHNFKKVEIKNGKKKYHIIKLRDIKINDPSELTFDIVDNISLTISLIIKKVYGYNKGKSFLSKLGGFNANKKMEQFIKSDIPKISQEKIDNATPKKEDTQNEKSKAENKNEEERNENKENKNDEKEKQNEENKKNEEENKNEENKNNEENII